MYVCLYFIQVLLPSALPRSPLRYVSLVQSLTLFELVCMSLIFYRSHLLPYFSPALTISSLLPLPPPQPLRCMSPPFFFAGLHALYEEQKCVCACMCTWIVQRLSPKAQLAKRLNGQSKGNRELACFYALRISAQFNCSFFFFFAYSFTLCLFLFVRIVEFLLTIIPPRSLTLYVLHCLPQWETATKYPTKQMHLCVFGEHFSLFSLDASGQILRCHSHSLMPPFPWACVLLVCSK